jgi:hypothetical protein
MSSINVALIKPGWLVYLVDKDMLLQNRGLPGRLKTARFLLLL